MALSPTRSLFYGLHSLRRCRGFRINQSASPRPRFACRPPIQAGSDRLFPLAEKKTYTSATPPAPRPVPENACLFVQNRRPRSSSSRSPRIGRTLAHPLPHAPRHHGFWPTRHRFTTLPPRLRITTSVCSPRWSHRPGPTQPRRHLLVSSAPPCFLS